MQSFSLRASLLILVVTASATAAAEPTPTAGAADHLAYTDCSEQTALLVVPAAVLPKLPPGFAYTPPAGGGALASIHISGTRCDSLDGGGPSLDVLAFAQVTPPAALIVPEVQYYAIALGGYSNRTDTVAKFASWGIPDLIARATVTYSLTVLPLTRIGMVKAQSTTSSLTTQMTGIGVPTPLAGGRTRGYYVRNGVLIASFDAVYTTQQSVYAIGSVVPNGACFLPSGAYPAAGSHAFDFDLSVGYPLYY